MDAHKPIYPASLAGIPHRDRPFRFYDNREKYLLFVTTCNEKQVISDRVAMDIMHIQPVPPALRVFDAGMGDATVLSGVMRYLHYSFPTVPFLVVGKEISHEDVRISLEKMPDRFQEHPLTVLVVTNMLYSEAPRLFPRSKAMQEKLTWLEVALEGNSSYDFNQQIRELTPYIQDWWQTVVSERTGNPVYASPVALVMYRKDHEWPLGPVIPRKGDMNHEYDVIIAAQPFRARQRAEVKVRNVLAPLSRSLAPGGVMVVVQSIGKDPGMEIIRRIWPGETPFQTSRHELMRELQAQLGDERSDLRFLSYPDSRAEFRYYLQLPTADASTGIGTSTLLAAWNAATYVAQIEDERLQEVMRHGDYLDVTWSVLEKYNGLWFIDESFIVTRVNSGG
ncbi:MAG: hypothetical protein L0177_02545 [Chloroflexi bacterium]|nr:hypothetical protein [Chloroflexota bacterium]